MPATAYMRLRDLSRQSTDSSDWDTDMEVLENPFKPRPAYTPDPELGYGTMGDIDHAMVNLLCRHFGRDTIDFYLGEESKDGNDDGKWECMIDFMDKMFCDAAGCTNSKVCSRASSPVSSVPPPGISLQGAPGGESGAHALMGESATPTARWKRHGICTSISSLLPSWLLRDPSPQTRQQEETSHSILIKAQLYRDSFPLRVWNHPLNAAPRATVEHAIQALGLPPHAQAADTLIDAHLRRIYRADYLVSTLDLARPGLMTCHEFDFGRWRRKRFRLPVEWKRTPVIEARRTEMGGVSVGFCDVDALRVVVGGAGLWSASRAATDETVQGGRETGGGMECVDRLPRDYVVASILESGVPKGVWRDLMARMREMCLVVEEESEVGVVGVVRSALRL
ncbi:hypothetical protein ACRALDRAFT_1066595 [Sodiomyces alcalophilus JCM 7366]|uniref:uncharacterized protein n=1 Tax=Sodiomyces alcalophilus JCM 7366 TaxID=591952 RepID=UPI0039B51166